MKLVIAGYGDGRLEIEKYISDNDLFTPKYFNIRKKPFILIVFISS